MLSYSSCKGIYERLITDGNGRFLRLHFAVVEIDGRLKGRVIAIEPVGQLQGMNEKPRSRFGCFLLTACNHRFAAEPAGIISGPVVSPYFSLDFLITSQPTRAPAFK